LAAFFAANEVEGSAVAFHSTSGIETNHGVAVIFLIGRKPLDALHTASHFPTHRRPRCIQKLKAGS
jgi:hypothetical protein